MRPGLFLQTADLYLRLGRWRDAQQVYEKALAIDPDNAHAYIGVCRMALRRRKFGVAVHSALDALQRIYHYPLAHFLLGRALAGMREYQRAAEAFRAAISLNPNFPEAHVRLAALLEKHLGDTESAREHRRLARRMRRRGAPRPLHPPMAEPVENHGVVWTPTGAPLPAAASAVRPLVAERVENHGVVWTPTGAPPPAAPSAVRPPIAEEVENHGVVWTPTGAPLPGRRLGRALVGG